MPHYAAWVYLDRLQGNRIFRFIELKRGVIPMEEIASIISVVASLDPTVLPFVVVLAAIGLCAMALWTVVRLSGQGKDK